LGTLNIIVAVTSSVLCLTAVGCSSAPISNTPAPSVATQLKPLETGSSEPTNWVKTETISQMDGTKEILLMTSAIGRPGGFLVVRFKGRKLDVYVNTGDMVDDESSSVRIKFDDGAPVRQTWTRSTDYKAVFSPYPLDLLTRLQLSNKFFLEYRPYQRVPDTIAFNAAGLAAVLPQTEMDVLRKKSDNDAAAIAALKARVQRNIHECEEKNLLDELLFPGQWCWTDPNNALYDHEGTPFPTKEEALSDAMDKARMGLAFKKPSP
jgi:hypothetical protein